MQLNSDGGKQRPRVKNVCCKETHVENTLVAAVCSPNCSCLFISWVPRGLTVAYSLIVSVLVSLFPTLSMGNYHSFLKKWSAKEGLPFKVTVKLLVCLSSDRMAKDMLLLLPCIKIFFNYAFIVSYEEFLCREISSLWITLLKARHSADGLWRACCRTFDPWQICREE